MQEPLFKCQENSVTYDTKTQNLSTYSMVSSHNLSFLNIWYLMPCSLEDGDFVGRVQTFRGAQRLHPIFSTLCGLPVCQPQDAGSQQWRLTQSSLVMAYCSNQGRPGSQRMSSFPRMQVGKRLIPHHSFSKCAVPHCWLDIPVAIPPPKIAQHLCILL